MNDVERRVAFWMTLVVLVVASIITNMHMTNVAQQIGGPGPIDLMIGGYDVQTVGAALTSYGEEGRKLYLATENFEEWWAPPLYAFTLLTIIWGSIGFMNRRIGPRSWWFFLRTVAFGILAMSLILEYQENGFVREVLSDYPVILRPDAVGVYSTITQWKWVLIITSAVGALSAAFATLVVRFTHR